MNIYLKKNKRNWTMTSPDSSSFLKMKSPRLSPRGRRGRLTWAIHEDNGVGVKVEHAFPQEFHRRRHVSAAAGGAGRHELLTLGETLRTLQCSLDLHPLFRQRTDVADVDMITLEKGVEGLRVLFS